MTVSMNQVLASVLAFGLVAGSSSSGLAQDVSQASSTLEYRVLATNRTSTMEQELNEAAREGFRFEQVMGGETAIGGNETVVIVSRRPGAEARFEYRLLATSRTSTMQREMQQAADAGFHYRGQTVFDTMFGGDEVISIFERDVENDEAGVWEFLLLATTRTGTMEEELQEAAGQGYELVGMTVADTAFRGKELVSIMRRRK